MARRKKRIKSGGGSQPPRAAEVPERISRPFADALKDMDLADPKDGEGPADAQPSPVAPTHRQPHPSPPVATAEPPPATSLEDAEYSYEDRAAFHQAFSGVRPIDAPGSGKRHKARKVAPPPGDEAAAAKAADAAARDRLSSLVADGLRFEVTREPGWVEGIRAGAPAQALKDLKRGRANPEATLDLHGRTAAETAREVDRFLRQEQRRGVRVACIVHGKGLHSAGGAGVLGDQVLRTIMKGAAAPIVLAFVTTALDRGGSGALLVRLSNR